jgi:protein-S-isoprenylcysteine O-methyltransferase Ste14
MPDAVSLPYNNVVARIIPAALNVIVIVRIGQSYLANPGQIILLMSLAIEALTLVLILTAHVPKNVSFTVKTALISFVPSFFFLFCELTGGTRLAPPAVVIGVMGTGLSLQIYAKLTIGRCFGILPANRGIIESGPYGIVRHPIYLGYLITHVGFMLGSFSLWNVGVLLVVYALLAARVIEEEKILGLEPAYQRYSGRVRYRAIPGIF